MNYQWNNIEPGDLVWTSGGGVVGWIIRVFTQHPYAHVGVVTQVEGDLLTMDEAFPGGLRRTTRGVQTVSRAIRVHRTPEEARTIVSKSNSLVGSKYAYGELLRIAAWRVDRVVELWAVLALIGLVLSAWPFMVAGFSLIAFGLLKHVEWDSDRLICSNHVAQSVLAARPDISLSHVPSRIWPGKLEDDLQYVVWEDQHEA